MATEQQPGIDKAQVGIRGYDAITEGGLPRGRVTLVIGASARGKTVFGMEFLVRSATEQGEPGAFISFEESEEELAANFHPLGFDLERLCGASLGEDYTIEVLDLREHRELWRRHQMLATPTAVRTSPEPGGKAAPEPGAPRG
jgi:KaiC/GvpD/RAD55 family RecA-like ATPase